MASETMCPANAPMTRIERLWRADRERPSRFHDCNGRLHLHPDMVRSGFSTLARIAFDKYPTLPWLTYAAIDALRPLVGGRRVFEYGSGTSTAWFARKAASIVSVENNSAWAERVRIEMAGVVNAEILVQSDFEAMIRSIPSDRDFDLFVVDCETPPGSALSTENFRIRCLAHVMTRARPGAVIVVDNTDTMKTLSSEVDRLSRSHRVVRHAGWVPGILHPNGTTIIQV